jgi:hypothetical protein
MPTPTRVFAELAEKHGGVDLNDMPAVQRWYEEVLPTLPPEVIEEILEELLSGEGLEDVEAGGQVYPADAPLPRLDEAPPVAPPLLAAGLREFIRRLLTRRLSDDLTDT